jgi:ActR/RegA family two-component response regulator
MIDEIIKNGSYKLMLIDDDDLEYMQMLKNEIESKGYQCILNTSTSWITHNVFLELEVLSC